MGHTICVIYSIHWLYLSTFPPDRGQPSGIIWPSKWQRLSRRITRWGVIAKSASPAKCRGRVQYILTQQTQLCPVYHDDVIKWKHYPRHWPFVRGIHRSPVNSPHKGQWRGALMFSLICVWIDGAVNNRESGDSRRYRAHYDVTIMLNKMSNNKLPVIWDAITLMRHHCHVSSSPLDKIAAISQTIFWEAFSWMKSLVFWLKFHWSLLLTITHYWFR